MGGEVLLRMECNIEEHIQESLWDNDDSYIEIELDPSWDGKSNIKPNESDEEEYEVRISISSTIPLPHGTPTPASASTSSLNSATFIHSPLNHSTLSLTQTHDQLQPTLKFPPLNTLFNFKLFWENRQSPSHNHMITIPFNTHTNMDMLCTTSTRKQGSVRKTNGGMMKMLVKFRGIKLRTLLSSLVKPRAARKDKKEHSRKCRSILQCYDESMVMNPSDERSMRKSTHWDLNNEEYSFRSSKRSMVEIDLGGVRGMSNGQKGGSRRQSRSTSCHTSPIHQGLSLSSADNNIQAAIAYCKTSFGQTSDFSFSP